ncbi:MAG: MFS transporter, partial [Bacteroidota bacterium]
IIKDLIENFQLVSYALYHLTSAVQFGFIVGTLVYALLNLADRFPPARLFFVSILAGALFNLFMLWPGNDLFSLILFRFLTGFFLAGIYPVGMKIAADYYQKGLDKSLGYLVGALVLGTAFPHYLQGSGYSLPWRWVVGLTSLIAVLGGLLMWLGVGNGPYRRPSKSLDMGAIFRVFRDRPFRAAAFGYFGHMWELYTFWTFVPVMLIYYTDRHPFPEISLSFLCFLIIGIGGPACVLGGYISQSLGSKTTATGALLLSGICCLLSPLVLLMSAWPVFLGFLFFWASVVIADSPLFSTMVAHSAPPTIKGSALTIVNSLGFLMTIFSIQLIQSMQHYVGLEYVFLLLALGPLFGLLSLRMSPSQVSPESPEVSVG